MIGDSTTVFGFGQEAAPLTWTGDPVKDVYIAIADWKRANNYTDPSGTVYEPITGQYFSQEVIDFAYAEIPASERPKSTATTNPTIVQQGVQAESDPVRESFVLFSDWQQTHKLPNGAYPPLQANDGTDVHDPVTGYTLQPAAIAYRDAQFSAVKAGSLPGQQTPSFFGGLGQGAKWIPFIIAAVVFYELYQRGKK